MITLCLSNLAAKFHNLPEADDDQPTETQGNGLRNVDAADRRTKVNLRRQLCLVNLQLSDLMWFKSSKRWKVVDLSATRNVGHSVPIPDLHRCPPEAAKAVKANLSEVVASTALDMWMIGCILHEAVMGPVWGEMTATAVETRTSDSSNKSYSADETPALGPSVTGIESDAISTALREELLGRLVNKTYRIDFKAFETIYPSIGALTSFQVLTLNLP